ncbi:MAG TPA: hypothetical protein VEW93_07915 [Acidimicrobiales bacterium]|nr:hypothetical protein [Acidimicrobiales bacterium]
MRPVLARTLFYGGTLLAVVVMCQSWFEDALTSLLGDDTGADLYSFVRTNVEAPISVIAIALYLDVVLRHRSRPDDAPAARG